MKKIVVTGVAALIAVSAAGCGRMADLDAPPARADRARHARDERGPQPARAATVNRPASQFRTAAQLEPLWRFGLQPRLGFLAPFRRIDGALQAEGVPLERSPTAVGTPAYVYSTATLTRHYGLLPTPSRPIRRPGRPRLIAFAVKANPICRCWRPRPARLRCRPRCPGEDPAGAEGRHSRGPHRLLRRGQDRRRTAFAIDVVCARSMSRARSSWTRLIARGGVEGRAAGDRRAGQSSVGAGGHAKITTGGATDSRRASARSTPCTPAPACPTCDAGRSGLSHRQPDHTLEPLEAAFPGAADHDAGAASGRADGVAADLGGGLGVPYHGQSDLPSIEAYVAMAARVLDGLEVEAAFEPGRLLAANAGVLLSRVIQVNERGGFQAGARRFRCWTRA
jgi:diaminopimelate decarboxylase